MFCRLVHVHWKTQLEMYLHTCKYVCMHNIELQLSLAMHSYHVGSENP